MLKKKPNFNCRGYLLSESLFALSILCTTILLILQLLISQICLIEQAKKDVEAAMICYELSHLKTEEVYQSQHYQEYLAENGVTILKKNTNQIQLKYQGKILHVYQE